MTALSQWQMRIGIMLIGVLAGNLLESTEQCGPRLFRDAYANDAHEFPGRVERMVEVFRGLCLHVSHDRTFRYPGERAGYAQPDPVVFVNLQEADFLQP
ncbi:MAG TPA: hypothetical protein VGO08_16970 [Burkholderiales bacterium]|nr:hypothetical protein [Burkholderiales bacterium]